MSQNDKILKWFFYITASVMVFGSILLVADNDFDMYVAWNLVGYIVGVYLISKLK